VCVACEGDTWAALAATIGTARKENRKRFFKFIDYIPHLKGGSTMETRVAVVAIIVQEGAAVTALNDLLHQYAKHIIGRMGVPYHARGVSIISVAMDAPAGTISALSGKLGRLPGVTAKTVYAPEEALQGPAAPR